jgi:hypothetical protein
MKTIFLIVWLNIANGHPPVKLEYTAQADAPTCFAAATKAWGRYTERLKDITNEYELSVGCVLGQDDSDPA